MNVLLIHAHPEPKSFTSALKDVAVEHFESLGHNVLVKDLYKMKFNPVGHEIDFITKSNTEFFSYLKEQMNAFLHNSFSPELMKEMEDLKNADFILLNFPLWWSSMPAILKGWIDRVFALGFAYHPKDKKYSSGGFIGKKAMCCITTGGSQAAYSPGGENEDIMNAIYHINHGMLAYTGMTVLPSFFAWRAHLSDETTLKTYIEQYKEHLKNLDNFKPLY